MSHDRVARLQGYRVAGLQGCRVTGLQGCKVTGLQGYRVAGLQGCRVARLQGCKVTGLCHNQDFADKAQKDGLNGTKVHKKEGSVYSAAILNLRTTLQPCNLATL